MKKLILLLPLLLTFSFASIAQKKDKIKGDKNVTTVTNNIDKGFTAIEISDDLKVNLTKSVANSYILTTKKNLQAIVKFTVS